MEDKKTFEENIEKAKDILQKLMDPSISMSDSIKEYKNGLQELKLAEEKLTNAKLEYEELSKHE